MEIDEFRGIMKSIVEQVETNILKGKRDEILNERFFHHMFSTRIHSLYHERGIDVWDNSILIPESPTPSRFLWTGVKLESVEKTKTNAIGKGKSGSYDFQIDDPGLILVEWKGPKVYSEMDIVKVMLKLFTETDRTSIKIFSAIITSANKVNTSHRSKLESRLLRGFDFVRRVLDLTNDDLSSLHVYVVTIPITGCDKLFWDSDWHDKYLKFLDE